MRYVWCEYDFAVLHAVSEKQVGSSQDAYCGDAPAQGLGWHLAEGSFAKLPRCKKCVKETASHVDVTERAARAVQRGDRKELLESTKKLHGT